MQTAYIPDSINLASVLKFRELMKQMEIERTDNQKGFITYPVSPQMVDKTLESGFSSLDDGSINYGF